MMLRTWIPTCVTCAVVVALTGSAWALTPEQRAVSVPAVPASAKPEGETLAPQRTASEPRNALPNPIAATSREGQSGLPNYAEKITAYIAIAMAFIATWQAWMFRRQLVLMRESMNTAASTSQRQLTAYVFVEEMFYEVSPDEFRVDIRVKNMGQTPCHLTCVRLGIAFTPSKEQLHSFEAPKSVHNVRVSLAQGGEHTLQNGVKVAANLASEVEGGRVRLHVFGVIEYDDIYESQRATHFRFATFRGEKEMRAMHEGNHVI